MSFVRYSRNPAAHAAAFLLLLQPFTAFRAGAAAPATSPQAGSATRPAPHGEGNEVIDVAPVWAGHPVGFALFTHAPSRTQFVAYYDEQRRMTVASRPLDSAEWTRQVLDTTVGWDSHNYIEMTVDDDGHLHVAGNMHGVPLIYFRTTRPLDVTSFARVEHMIGALERKVTYPRFFRGPANELIFTYRDGGSGNGNQIYNVYDSTSRTWSRLLDRPLVDGQGLRNAYLRGPERGPDGYWHLVWVWRDTPDCETNHTLSYARSRDLRRWETGAGRPLELPITIETADVVDPVPVEGGMLNGNTMIGFDADKRVIVSYHKFDEAGRTQVYNARLEDGRWRHYRASDWTYRWDFRGRGTIGAEIRIGGVRVGPDGTLTQTYSHARHGDGAWRLDPKTLKATGQVDEQPPPTTRPKKRSKPEGDFPGLEVRRQGDAGRSPDPGVTYQLRWETLGSNRDRPRPEPWPAPSTLRVYKLAKR